MSERIRGAWVMRYTNRRIYFTLLLYFTTNSILGKLGRTASEEIIIELIENKCIPALLYGPEVCPSTKSDLRSL